MHNFRGVIQATVICNKAQTNDKLSHAECDFYYNIALRRIFGPRRDEVTGEWRKLHKEELYAMYSSNIICPQIKMDRTYGGEKMCIQGFRGET